MSPTRMKTYSVYYVNLFKRAIMPRIVLKMSTYISASTYLLIKVLNTRFLYLCLSMFISLVREMTYLIFFVTHLP